jgi:hypothetical protein
LPHLEELPLYELWADPETTETWRPGLERFTPDISLFICPSDPQNTRNATIPEEHATNSYVANCGYWPPPTGHECKPTSKSTRAAAVDSQYFANGVFTNQLPLRKQVRSSKSYYVITTAGADWIVHTPYKKHIDHSHLLDGTTHTLAFSESLQAGPWDYVEFDPLCGELFDGARLVHGMVWHRAVSSDVVPINSGRSAHGGGQPASTGHPSSLHGSLVNAAFLDGGVRTLKETIDYQVYQALLTPRGKASDVLDKTFVLTDDHLR